MGAIKKIRLLNNIDQDTVQYLGNLIFKDEFEKATVDTSLWDIVNPDATSNKFSIYNKTLNIFTAKSYGSSFHANYISTKATFNNGIVRFTLGTDSPDSVTTSCMIAIMSDINNRITFLHDYSTRSWNFYIVIGGVTVHTVLIVVDSFADVKVVINSANLISLYVLKSSTWTLITSYTANIGPNKKFYVTNRGLNYTSDNNVSVSSLYITDTDYATLTPFKKLSSGDARMHGVTAGETSSSTAINTLLASSEPLVKICSGIYKIDASLKVPSNKIVILENAIIRLNNGKYDNIFRNSDFTGNTNITIQVTKGYTILDQNTTNNNDTTSRTTWGVQNANSYKYVGLCFCNVSGLRLSGYIIYDYSGWAHLIQRCNTGYAKSIKIEPVTGIVNQDGLDIGHGTYDFEITNITGKSFDDFVAILSWGDGTFTVRDYHGGDTRNLNFTTIKGSQSGSGNFIRFLAGDGGTIKNISMLDITVNSVSYNAILFGTDNYPVIKPGENDIENITIDNITITAIEIAGKEAIGVYSSCSDISITNMLNDSGHANYNIDRTGRSITNFNINGTAI